MSRKSSTEGGRGDYEIVIPTRNCNDLQNKDNTIDAHIRIEHYDQIGTSLNVDLFISGVELANDAHIASQLFSWTNEGANEATHFLQKHGFRVALMIKK